MKTSNVIFISGILLSILLSFPVGVYMGFEYSQLEKGLSETLPNNEQVPPEVTQEAPEASPEPPQEDLNLQKVNELEEQVASLKKQVKALKKANKDLLKKEKPILLASPTYICPSNPIVEYQYHEPSRHRFYGMGGYGVKGAKIQSDGNQVWSEPTKGFVGGFGYQYRFSERMVIGGGTMGSETYFMTFGADLP